MACRKRGGDAQAVALILRIVWPEEVTAMPGSFLPTNEGWCAHGTRPLESSKTDIVRRAPSRRRLSLQRAPYIAKNIVQCRVMFLQLRAHERVEVIAIEVGFGSFGEILLVVGQGIMTDRLAVV